MPEKLSARRDYFLLRDQTIVKDFEADKSCKNSILSLLRSRDSQLAKRAFLWMHNPDASGCQVDLVPYKNVARSGKWQEFGKVPFRPICQFCVGPHPTERRHEKGSSGRTRTYNPPVNSRMLCH